jgi:hypothetical protein
LDGSFAPHDRDLSLGRGCPVFCVGGLDISVTVTPLM